MSELRNNIPLLNIINFKEFIPTKFRNSSKKIKRKKSEEDDYSQLAGGKNYTKNNNSSTWIKKLRYSEDRNDFHTKWKTEICHYWEMYGFCKYGDSCAFAHGESELNQRKMSNNYKTKPCKQFFELGYCTYGVRCQFSHKLKEDTINSDKKSKISYLKIINDFNQINHDILRRPRLMTFENITSCTLDECEKNRLELYEDILREKKKGNENSEFIFSINSIDESLDINSDLKNDYKKIEIGIFNST